MINYIKPMQRFTNGLHFAVRGGDVEVWPMEYFTMTMDQDGGQKTFPILPPTQARKSIAVLSYSFTMLQTKPAILEIARVGSTARSGHYVVVEAVHGSDEAIIYDSLQEYTLGSHFSEQYKSFLCKVFDYTTLLYYFNST